eukprot:CAMPEP_0171168210 /NCGR_PEP_ID=MMETSP0790-20130122/7594_1 /TAXON_ID=2925 /ORGANISM="Alexandrium catenella, Strain OF101" /LENGTH=124 /DNA_ID=CAMNT_0011633045 /DNA_START=309 /DNA_END=680 /DNA_ORIENTATION=+
MVQPPDRLAARHAPRAARHDRAEDRRLEEGEAHLDKVRDSVPALGVGRLEAAQFFPTLAPGGLAAALLVAALAAPAAPAARATLAGLAARVALARPRHDYTAIGSGLEGRRHDPCAALARKVDQ